MEEWRTVFWLSAGVFVSAIILFWIFGSAQIQTWNDLSHHNKPIEILEEEKQMTVMEVPVKELQTDADENERL